MTPADHESGHSHELSSQASSSTTVSRDEACLQDDKSEKYATIVDIDVATQSPKRSLTFKRPSIDELIWKGPSQIMREAPSHGADIRWVHLRSNCMHWVEELMHKVWKERGMNLESPVEDALEGSPTCGKNPILRKDLWSHVFHGKHSDQIQTRFMGPACAAFSLDALDEESDGTGSTRGSRDNLVLYLPYMHWESSHAWSRRQALVQAVSRGKPGEPHADRDFLEKYLKHATAPFHDRRSLDQAYFHDFGMTTSLGQSKQVMEEYIENFRELEEPKLIVIDQLWLWIIRGSTTDSLSTPDVVITAFPDRFDGAHDSANVYRGIVQHLERGLQPPLRKAEDLVACIIEHCTGVFFQRQLEHDKWFLEFFAAAIGSVRQRQKAAYKSFCDKCKYLEQLQTDHASLVKVVELLEHPAFAITEETTLFREIKDIVDELSRVDYILSRQEGVVRSLTRINRSRSIKLTFDMVRERREAWASVAGTAKVAYDEIEAQMDLKQKQSSLSETRNARYQSEETARHGRIMLLFTVVTIVFLPMSFMATFFGMNPEVRAMGGLKLGAIAAIIFPISLVITGVALVVGFSERAREGVRGVVEAFRGCFGGDGGERERGRGRRRSRRSTEDLEMGSLERERERERERGGGSGR